MKSDGIDPHFITTNEEVRDAGYYPDANTSMSSGWRGQKTLLDNTQYQTLGSILPIFPLGSRMGSYYKETSKISIFDTKYNEGLQRYEIVSLEHGYNGCGHTYVELLNRQEPGVDRVI